MLKQLLIDEEGATAIEYGLISALVAVGLIAALTIMAKRLGTQFYNVGDVIRSQQETVQ